MGERITARRGTQRLSARLAFHCSPRRPASNGSDAARFTRGLSVIERPGAVRFNRSARVKVPSSCPPDAPRECVTWIARQRARCPRADRRANGREMATRTRKSLPSFFGAPASQRHQSAGAMATQEPYASDLDLFYIRQIASHLKVRPSDVLYSVRARPFVSPGRVRASFSYHAPIWHAESVRSLRGDTCSIGSAVTAARPFRVFAFLRHPVGCVIALAGRLPGRRGRRFHATVPTAGTGKFWGRGDR